MLAIPRWRSVLAEARSGRRPSRLSTGGAKNKKNEGLKRKESVNDGNQRERCECWRAEDRAILRTGIGAENVGSRASP